jgi:cell division septation protein DedD
MTNLKHNLLNLVKAMLALFVVCAAAGTVSSKYISHKLNEKIKERRTADKNPPEKLFFYNSIGATPALENSKEIKFDKSKKFTIEVGYTKTRRGAAKVVDRLNLNGFPVFMTPVQLKNGRVIYKVRMGLFADSRKAKLASSVLRKRTKYKGKLVSLN